jgi:hypothetical protein
VDQSITNSVRWGRATDAAQPGAVAADLSAAGVQTRGLGVADGDFTTWTYWRKSSRSGESNCVEVLLTETEVLVRDSKAPDAPPLRFSRESWNAFLSMINSSDLGNLFIADTTSGR